MCNSTLTYCKTLTETADSEARSTGSVHRARLGGALAGGVAGPGGPGPAVAGLVGELDHGEETHGAREGGHQGGQGWGNTLDQEKVGESLT